MRKVDGESIPDPVFQLRRGDRGDAAALADFAARTYAQTFGHATRPDDLAVYLASSYSEQQQAIELTDPNVITILAMGAELTLAGYAQVRRHRPPACVAGQDPVELWRFYVDLPWQGSGLASALLTAAMSATSELGGKTVWLSVWEENARAISFYRKNGFRDVGAHPFLVGQIVRQTASWWSNEYVEAACPERWICTTTSTGTTRVPRRLPSGTKPTGKTLGRVAG